MGLFDSPEPFKGQDYYALKKSCLETGQPFEDPQFPTAYSSLFFTPDKVRAVPYAFRHILAFRFSVLGYVAFWYLASLQTRSSGL